MNVSRWGVNNPVAAVIMFFVMCLAGLVGCASWRLPQLPDLKVPEITITVTLPGAAPAQLETDVTRKIEDAVATLIDVDKVLSTITEGRSADPHSVRPGPRHEPGHRAGARCHRRIRVDLPQDIDEPEVARVNAHWSVHCLSYAVLSDRLAPDELSWFVDDTVRKACSRVRRGRCEFFRVGGLDREVRVDAAADVLQAFGITAGTVSAQLARTAGRTVRRTHHPRRRRAGRAHRGDGAKSAAELASIPDRSARRPVRTALGHRHRHRRYSPIPERHGTAKWQTGRVGHRATRHRYEQGRGRQGRAAEVLSNSAPPIRDVRSSKWRPGRSRRRTPTTRR